MEGMEISLVMVKEEEKEEEKKDTHLKDTLPRPD